jgi:N-hydroxyarylamine O-acetyltransferase
MIDEWEIDRLDLTAYLQRIGYHGPLAPTEQTLVGLHRAHVLSIPFENLDVMLGRAVRVDLDSVQAKLVAARRGGYCYEHGVLFAAVLERLGWTVSRLLARVGHDQQRPRPRTHMALRVGNGAGEWLADVGFGDGILEPLAWNTPGTTQAQGRWLYQLISSAPGHRRLRQVTSEPKVLYSFTEEPQHASDIEMASYYTSTHPRSPFVRQPVLMRRTLDTQLRLNGRRLTTTGPDGTTHEEILDDAQFAAALSERFHIELEADEIKTIVRPARARAARCGETAGSRH